MKIKVFSAFSEATLEKKVNAFIADEQISVSSIQFQASFGTVYAMVTYEEKKQAGNIDRFANI